MLKDKTFEEILYILIVMITTITTLDRPHVVEMKNECDFRMSLILTSLDIFFVG